MSVLFNLNVSCINFLLFSDTDTHVWFFDFIHLYNFICLFLMLCFCVMRWNVVIVGMLSAAQATRIPSPAKGVGRHISAMSGFNFFKNMYVFAAVATCVVLL